MQKRFNDFKKNYGKISLIFFSLILFFITFYLYNVLHTTDILKVSFLDIGQGDALIIESPTHKQIMIDGGPNDIVIRKLSSEMNFFDKDIDAIIATHPDADHITGFIPVLEKFNVKNIIETYLKGHTQTFSLLENKIENANKNNGANRYVAHKGDVIDLGGGVTLTFIFPSKNNQNEKDTNEASLVALLNYKENNFLFMGDLPKDKEDEVLNSNLVPRNITVLKVGHHGSDTSSSDKFINYLKPTYSILSVGKNNRYGHPKESVVEILKKYSQSVMSTIDYGSITFETDGRNLNIETEK